MFVHSYQPSGLGSIAQHLLRTGLVILVVCCGPPGTDAVREVSPAQMLALKAEGALLVDVRTAEEYAAGHIPGALNLPHDQVSARVEELGTDPSREIVVYCRGGRRAGLAADALLGAGFDRIFHLRGHMAGWQKAGFPVDESAERVPISSR